MKLFRIAIGSDHAGFSYKQKLIEHLRRQGHSVQDFGTHSEDSCDYPDFCRPAAEAVVKGQADRAIVLGGSGNGEAIVANRVRGVRCGLCWNVETAKLNRQHNDGNCLSLGQRMVPFELALAIVDTWMQTEFEGGRHTQRIQKIDAG